MPAVIHCPSCSRQLRVPDNLAGQKVQCPSCGGIFTADAEGGELPAVPLAEEAPRAPSRRPAVPPPEEAYEEESPQPRRRPAPRAEAKDYEDEPPEEGEYEDRPRPRRRRRRLDLQPHRGTMILVLGILGFFCLGIILGPMAWVMGNNDLREMRAGRMDPEGEGLTNAGRICGMIVTILHLGLCLLYGIFIVLAGAGGALR